MNYQYLDFIVFKGFSVVSKAIKFYTRSNYSHVGFMMNSNTIIEAWNHGGGMKQWWDYSTAAAHSNGTPYELWRIAVTEEDYDKVHKLFIGWVDSKLPYDWKGIVGFVLKGGKDSKVGRFCSEGCIEPLVDVFGWDRIQPSKVSPEDFVRIIQAAGAERWKEGKVINGLL